MGGADMPNEILDCVLEQIGEVEDEVFLAKCSVCGKEHLVKACWEGKLNRVHRRPCGSEIVRGDRGPVFGRVDREQDKKDLVDTAERLGLTLADVKNWKAACKKWKDAGYPTRTDEEVEACLAVCHEPCEFYRKQWGGRCAACRCCVNKSQMGTFNKARMATEDCPAGKWPKVAGDTSQYSGSHARQIE
jgi:hypothetical protein